ncbi:hypothetical protein F4780DRAFT_90027 [Xylariomycetidae sp. FL0641]|nr:hypothetical protein F4780DRAFT_90027 [Xylariomycetidae sp. FL0641]
MHTCIGLASTLVCCGGWHQNRTDLSHQSHFVDISATACMVTGRMPLSHWATTALHAEKGSASMPLAPVSSLAAQALQLARPLCPGLLTKEDRGAWEETGELQIHLTIDRERFDQKKAQVRRAASRARSSVSTLKPVSFQTELSPERQFVVIKTRRAGLRGWPDARPRNGLTRHYGRPLQANGLRRKARK